MATFIFRVYFLIGHELQPFKLTSTYWIECICTLTLTVLQWEYIPTFVLLHEDFNSETVLAINHHNCYGDRPLFDVRAHVMSYKYT